MEETKNADAIETTSKRPEKKERLFTQTEVDEIIQNRLARSKFDREKEIESVRAEQESILNARLDEINAAESRKKCADYLSSKHYPAEYADLLDVSDFDAFSMKADALYSATAKTVISGDKRIIELTKRVVAYEYGLPEELAKRLQGTTEEELKEDAEKLSALVKQNQPRAPLGSSEAVSYSKQRFASRQDSKHIPQDIRRY